MIWMDMNVFNVGMLLSKCGCKLRIFFQINLFSFNFFLGITNIGNKTCISDCINFISKLVVSSNILFY